MNAASLQHDLQTLGYALVEKLVPDRDLAALRAEVDELLAAAPHGGGVRNVLGKSGKLRELANTGPPARLAAASLGPSARAMKLTVFDKTANANWKVPWHQDLTIAVARRQEIEGFGPWSIKDGTVCSVPAGAGMLMSPLLLHASSPSVAPGRRRVLHFEYSAVELPEGLSWV